MTIAHIFLFVLFGGIVLFVWERFPAQVRRFIPYVEWSTTVFGYWSLLLLGISLSAKPTPFPLPSFLMAAISFFFIYLFNRAADTASNYIRDSIVHINTPLTDHTLSQEQNQLIMYASAALALLYSSATGSHGFIFAGLLLTLFGLYFHPKIKLRRFFGISQLSLASTTTICTLWGYSLTSNTIQTFPINIAIFLTLGLFFAMNFLDLKTYPLDENCVYFTLPTIIGLRLAKIIISVSLFVCFGIASYVFNTPQLAGLDWALALIAASAVFLKQFPEEGVYGLYIFSVLCITAVKFIG